MKRKLKTWRQFVEEFKPFFTDLSNHDYTCIKYNGLHWHIHSEQKMLFGTEIEVIKYKSYVYTYKSKEKSNYWSWKWHEYWFELKEFFKEEEFEI